MRPRRTRLPVVIALAVIAATMPAGRADHCSEGFEHAEAPDGSGEPVCRGSLSDLFSDDDSPDPEGGSETFDPEGGLRATTTAPSSTTTTTTAPVDDADAGIDVGAALLDALDDETIGQVMRSPVVLDALGCDVVDISRCERVQDAVDVARDFVDRAFRAASDRSGRHRLAVETAVLQAAITGALVDVDGNLLFPTVMAAMPVVAALGAEALHGGEGELEALQSFTRLLVSLDARGRGYDS